MDRAVTEREELKQFLNGAFQTMDAVLAQQEAQLLDKEVGIVDYVGYGIVRVTGLPNIRAEELVLFPHNLQGLVFNIDAEEIGVILLGAGEDLQAGAEVRRTGRVLDIPVGESLIGRVVDALGRPLDNRGEIRTVKRLAVEREAPPVMARDPVTVPLQTGIKVMEEIRARGIKYVWMQPGTRSEEIRAFAKQHGIELVEDCVLVQLR